MSRSEESRSRSRAAVHGDTFVSPNTPNLGSLTPHVTQAWIFPDQPCFGQLLFTRMPWGYLGRLKTPHKNNFPVQKHDHIAPPGPCFALAPVPLQRLCLLLHALTQLKPQFMSCLRCSGGNLPLLYLLAQHTHALG